MEEGTILTIAALFLGAIAGSFLNALSFRFNTGYSILYGRSRCMRCGHTLFALDLIPILSYLFLLGRCRYCGSRISSQYPLVECSAALLSLGVYLTTSTPLSYILGLLFWMTVLFIMVYDLRHTIVPLSATLLLAILALSITLLSPETFLLYLLSGICLSIPLLLLPALSHGRLMGWGDGFVEFSLGFLLGPSLGLTALFLGIWSGALVGIILLGLRRGVTMKSEIPFVPFLALGALAAYFFHVDFFPTLTLLL